MSVGNQQNAQQLTLNKRYPSKSIRLHWWSVSIQAVRHYKNLIGLQVSPDNTCSTFMLASSGVTLSLATQGIKIALQVLIGRGGDISIGKIA
jgi:hypothetical protein